MTGGAPTLDVSFLTRTAEVAEVAMRRAELMTVPCDPIDIGGGVQICDYCRKEVGDAFAQKSGTVNSA